MDENSNCGLQKTQHGAQSSNLRVQEVMLVAQEALPELLIQTLPILNSFLDYLHSFWRCFFDGFEIEGTFFDTLVDQV